MAQVRNPRSARPWSGRLSDGAVRPAIMGGEKLRTADYYVCAVPLSASRRSLPRPGASTRPRLSTRLSPASTLVRPSGHRSAARDAGRPHDPVDVQQQRGPVPSIGGQRIAQPGGDGPRADVIELGVRVRRSFFHRYGSSKSSGPRDEGNSCDVFRAAGHGSGSSRREYRASKACSWRAIGRARLAGDHGRRGAQRISGGGSNGASGGRGTQVFAIKTALPANRQVGSRRRRESTELKRDRIVSAVQVGWDLNVQLVQSRRVRRDSRVQDLARRQRRAETHARGQHRRGRGRRRESDQKVDWSPKTDRVDSQIVAGLGGRQCTLGIRPVRTSIRSGHRVDRDHRLCPGVWRPVEKFGRGGLDRLRTPVGWAEIWRPPQFCTTCTCAYWRGAQPARGR